MNTSKGKKFLVTGLVAVMALAGTYMAFPQQLRMRANRPGLIGQFFGARDFIRGLELTSEQRDQIRVILTDNEIPVIRARHDLLKARLDIMRGVQGADSELANALLQSADLRAKILEQIKTLLTADQLGKLQARQQEMEQRIQSQLERLNKRLGG